MTEERIATITQAAEALHAAEQRVTNAAVYAMVRGHKSDVSAVLQTWRAQHPEAAVAVLEPPGGAGDAPEEPCGVTDGLAEAPPVPSREPRLAALARERREAQGALDHAQRRVQETSVAYQLGQVSARGALAGLREASRRARMAPAHELAPAFAAVQAARAALASYVGEQEARLAEDNLHYVPAGLR